MIYLIRDPRGVFSSRLSLVQFHHWTKSQFLEGVAGECRKYSKNIDFIRSVPTNPDLAELFKENFIIQRHEDLVKNPSEMACRLYRFLKLEIPEQVETFAKSNVIVRSWHEPNMTEKSPYPFKGQQLSSWQVNLAFEKVLQIQNICQNPMKTFGYGVIHNRADMDDANVAITGAVDGTLPYYIGLS